MSFAVGVLFAKYVYRRGRQGWQFVGIEFNPRSQAASNGLAGPSHSYRSAWIRSLSPSPHRENHTSAVINTQITGLVCCMETQNHPHRVYYIDLSAQYM